MGRAAEGQAAAGRRDDPLGAAWPGPWTSRRPTSSRSPRNWTTGRSPTPATRTRRSTTTSTRPPTRASRPGPTCARDAIWMYVDISHQIENFIPAEKRPEHFIHRGEKDYLMFKPIAKTLDEAIALYETQGLREVHRRLAGGDALHPAHAATAGVPGEDGPAGAGHRRASPRPPTTPRPSSRCRTSCKWMVTEPEDKIRHYLDLCLQERLAALEFYAEFAAKNGCQFCCAVRRGPHLGAQAPGQVRRRGPHLRREGQEDLPVRFLAPSVAATCPRRWK